MTEADVIQPSASTASTGKGIRYIGQHCYAYSGPVTVANSEIPLLDFTTGSGYVVAEFNISANQVSGDDFDWRIKMNGEDIIFSQITGPYDLSEHVLSPLKLILPPSTRLVVTLDNVSSGSGLDWSVTMTGRVYGAT